MSRSYGKRKWLLLWVFLNSPSSRAPQPQLNSPGQAWSKGRFFLCGKKIGQASHRCLLGCLLWPCQALNTLVEQKWQEMPERQMGTAQHCPALCWQPAAQSGTGQCILPGLAWLQDCPSLPAPSPQCRKVSPCPLHSASLPAQR